MTRENPRRRGKPRRINGIAWYWRLVVVTVIRLLGAHFLVVRWRLRRKTGAAA